MSRARERRVIEHRRDLDEYQAPYNVADLPELLNPGAQLYIHSCYDEVYILWETPESDEEWAERLAKLDEQAVKRAVTADKRKRAAEKQRQEQEAAERELYERLKKKYG
jgi:DNA segregation ATPase FtsK/SpoIIIE-like protein